MITLERHALSMSNSDEVDSRAISDLLIPLAKAGPEQAKRRGAQLGAAWFRRALNYGSPQLRTRLTYAYNLIGAGLADEADLAPVGDLCELALLANTAGLEILQTSGMVKASVDSLQHHRRLLEASDKVGAIIRKMSKAAGVQFYEDLRLREVEHGFGDVSEQELQRQIHSYLLYRLEGGESPADGFDRACTLIESIWRQRVRKKNKKAHLVSHGLFMRCFVMRFMHLSIEQFRTLGNPENCDVITIDKLSKLVEPPQFKCGKWGVTGLRLRDPMA